MTFLFRLHRKCAILRRLATTLLVVAAGLASPVVVSAQAPPGFYIQTGPTLIGGAGWQVGVVRTSRMFSREGLLVSDLEPLLRKSTEQARVALLVGAAVRLTGVERTIGNVPYRGFDLDVGVRAGPALSFSSRDDAIARNSRFSLLVEPALRITHMRDSGRIWYLELGTVRPSLRIGVWLGRGR